MISASSFPSQAEAAVARLEAQYPTASIFVSEAASGSAILALAGARSHIVYIGEATPQQKVELLAQARAAGIAGVGTAILFDFTRYTGMLDWQYIIRQNNVTPSMEPPPAKAAYLWSDSLGAMLVKGISHFVQGTECRAFTVSAEAYAWLGWE